MQTNDPQTQSLIDETKRRLADLKARLPAHSIPPSMMMELDELEERLEMLKRKEEIKS